MKPHTLEKDFRPVCSTTAAPGANSILSVSISQFSAGSVYRLASGVSDDVTVPMSPASQNNLKKRDRGALSLRPPLQPCAWGCSQRVAAETVARLAFRYELKLFNVPYHDSAAAGAPRANTARPCALLKYAEFSHYPHVSPRVSGSSFVYFGEFTARRRRRFDAPDSIWEIGFRRRLLHKFGLENT
ncbi:hypothetical protein EVAR_61786_1 [Eumeta japonica]|uniref:Uncharacterized protein n=1 Tax=Eumeta variegata TaxID=151549 RepID=A0A4C1YZ79_EUMVA|nr:hypothetical protein EVAR_61786_1 [Eumeta japonica]